MLRLPSKFSRDTWFQLIQPYTIVFLALQFLTRLGLVVYSHQFKMMEAWQWPVIFGWGFLFDIVVLGFYLLPVVAVHLFIRSRNWARGGPRLFRTVMFFIFTYIWLFTAVAEYFFWEEFGTRFNFIAVDYLIYTTEVIGNIKESYPLYPILGGIFVATLVLFLLCKNMLTLSHLEQNQQRVLRRVGLVFAALLLALFAVTSIDDIKLEDSAALKELASNGTYNLFYAYGHNELDYKHFYLTQDEGKVDHNIRTLLFEEESEFVTKDPKDITRLVQKQGPEKHRNVVIVAMESMGADFMGRFGNPDKLTPNLDKLSTQSLFFSNLYATGTRTVRGLEALTLSVPPTPGQSIVRRPGNDNLFSLGFVFQDRGYDTKFIYGGHGYFDNMNAFFKGNGFGIIDRTDFADSDITFSNVWGVCDEDLFDQVIKQADLSYENNKPFMDVVMTTSNHRPYTYPDHKIDIPSKTGGRAGGIKYADYAVGAFLKAARTKPWFKDTVFIFVADHTAGAAGKIDLSPGKYHIPAIFYSPGFIKPSDYKYTASQIDVAPTLLGLLNFSYYTKFYGEDLINDSDEAENAHAFISNYQKVGYLKGDHLTILQPQRKVEFFDKEKLEDKDIQNEKLMIDAITYYQYASGWKERMKRIPTVAKPLVKK